MTDAGIAAGFVEQGRLIPDEFITGEFPRISRLVTITGDGMLSAGAVLGRINDSGDYILSRATSTDGSETPDALLAEDVDCSAGDARALVYFSGEFNPERLQLGEGHSLATVTAAFRQRSLFLRELQD